MKKSNLYFFFILCFAVISCKKGLDKPFAENPIETTSTDMTVSSTGIKLSQAIELAIGFLQSKNPLVDIGLKNAETVVRHGMPYMHIVNTTAGFAIIGVDSMYASVLAYDSIGNFDKTNLNTGLVLWFNKHGRNLDFLRNHKSHYVDSITALNKKLWNINGSKFLDKNNKAKPRNISIVSSGNKIKVNDASNYVYTLVGYQQSTNVIGPLCSTYWDQSGPYNEYCPSGSYNGHTPAGCVPVAMAQVMHYWNYPANYDHSIMPLSLQSTSYPSNPVGYDEVARLIHDIGTTTGPTFINAVTGFSTSQFVYYDDNGSSANDYYCPYVFGAFGYSPASRTETISDQILWGAKNGTVYSGLLIDEIINHQRPCVVSGYGGQNDIFGLGIVYYPYFDQGHTWVCDGCSLTTTTITYQVRYIDPNNPGFDEPDYDQFTSLYSYSGYLHMNWGWGGYHETNNGWYDYLTNYSNPEVGLHDYGYFQTVVYNIHP